MGKESAHIDQQYDRQLEVNREQNAWQAAENQVDRQWQANEWTRQFEQQVAAQRQMFTEQLEQQSQSDYDKWKRQFDVENRYNSPQSQVARLMAAGINPAAAASQVMAGNASGASIGGSSSPSAAGAPSGGALGSHSVSPLGVSIPAYSTDSALFSSAAQLADSMSKLGELGLASEKQKATLGATVQNMMADTQNKQEQAAITRVQNSILSATGSAKVQSEIMKAYADTYAAYQKGDYDNAQSGINKLMADIENGRYKLDVQKQPFVLSALKNQADMYKSQSAANYASANASNASASLSTALANTADALRAGQLTGQNLQNQCIDIQRQLSARENVRDASTHYDKISAIVAQCENAGIITQQNKQQVDMLMKQNDWYSVQQFFGCLGDAAGAFGSVGNVLVGRERNDVQRQFNQVWSDYIKNRGSESLESGKRYRLDDNGLLFPRP